MIQRDLDIIRQLGLNKLTYSAYKLQLMELRYHIQNRTVSKWWLKLREYYNHSTSHIERAQYNTRAERYMYPLVKEPPLCQNDGRLHKEN